MSADALRLVRLWMPAVLVAACLGIAAADSASGETEQVTLALKWRHQFQFAGYYAAVEKGFYREAGLDVRIEEPEEAGDPVAAVLAGRANYGIGASDLVLQRALGKPVVVLAAIFQHSPHVLLADRKSGISSVHDLAGKRVAFEQETDELRAFLLNEGMRLDQITAVPLAFDPSPLARGEVDAISAYSTDEPYLLKQMGVDCVVLSPRAGGIDFYGDCLFTSENEAGQHRGRTKNFVEASLRGWKYALEHQDEIVELIHAKFSQRHSLDHLRFEAAEIRRLVLPEIVELGYVNPGRWQHIADTYAELGLIPKDYSLAGFFHERNPAPDLRRYRAAVAGLAALLAAVGLVVFWIYRMNRNLHREMAERSRAQDAARAAEQRFRMLVERAPFPIAISDPKTGRVRFCNEQWERDFHPDEKEAGDRCTVDSYENPVDRARILRLLEEQDSVRDFELQLKRHNGEAMWAYLSAALIDFGGEQALFVAFNDITARKNTEEENMRLIADLQQALQDVRTLRGLIPICSYCKRIRNDTGFWLQVDAYIQQHTDAEFSHGVCPECEGRLYQDLWGDNPPPRSGP